jgi:beta-glucosidase
MLAGAPPGFLLGAATSAYQIEGGNHNDWTEWEKGRYPDGTPHVLDGTSAARAADSWNFWRADLSALQLLGANVYRLGIEWSRLEPSEGAWDAAAAARYRQMFAALRAAGITPIVTLYHFTLPTWVAARGGWDWDGAPAALAAFAGRAGAAFGDLVDWWCTINEPNVLVAKSYLAGQWPPGARDPRRAALALAALMRAHGLMTGALR